MWAKQSTAATLIVGPILDSTGAEYTSAVIGDLSISKNGGTLTALAAAATLTHISNGQYTLVLTTGNLDTLGRAQITCNKATYQMPPIGLVVVPAMVFDSLVLGTDALDVSAIQFAGQTITAAAGVTIPASIASPTNITAATGITVATNNDKTGYSLTANTGLGNQTANITGNLSGSVGSVTGAVVLDSASRLAIFNTLTTENFVNNSFGKLWIISDGTNGREVKVTGAKHIAADVHECQADGLNGSTEITNIQNASGYTLAVLAGACADPQTSSETYAITVFGSTFTVDMAGQTSTGTRTAPTLTKS